MSSIRFRRTIKIAPGVRLNVGKSSSSVSLGGHGLSMNYGQKGSYLNVGVPGSGLSHRSRISSQPTQTRGTSTDDNKIRIDIELNDDGTVSYLDQNGHPLPDSLIKDVKRKNRDIIETSLERECFTINQGINSLLSIHLSTPSPNEKITFEPTPFTETPPVMPGSHFSVPVPQPPQKKEHGFLGNLITPIRKSIDDQNEEMLQKYTKELEEWNREKHRFEENYQKAKEDYLNKLQDYETNKRQHDAEQLRKLSIVENGRFEKLSDMQEFLEENFQALVWPKETTASFEIFMEDKTVLLDVDLPEIEDMPKSHATLNKQQLRVFYKNLSMTQLQNNYIVMVHSIGFRLIGEVIYDLPTIKTVVFSGYSQRINKKTGHIENEYLISTRAHRDIWEKINFDNLLSIDVVACFDQFEPRRNIKQSTMLAIEPFKG